MIRFLTATVLLMFIGSSYAADRIERKFYSQSGAYAGQSQTSRSTTKFYNSNGSYAGRAVTRGGSTSLYNNNGRYVGKVK